jgi:CspA family cold shock protein
MTLRTGTIRRFEYDHCYGFVVADDTGEDFFVHVTAAERGVYLARGTKVQFIAGFDRAGRPAAKSVRAV